MGKTDLCVAKWSPSPDKMQCINHVWCIINALPDLIGTELRCPCHEVTHRFSKWKKQYSKFAESVKFSTNMEEKWMEYDEKLTDLEM